MSSDDRELLDDQIRYYRARATEYDATFPSGDPFAVHSDRIRAAMRDFAPLGHALELAAGTGQWTALLAELADDLLATDASPEMLALNAAKVGDPEITYRVTDAFALEATHGFDTVFFGFFLSHVPPSRFGAFWAVLGGLLAPAGRVFFVDEAAHGLWDEDWVDREAGVVHRSLTDGTTHRAVKVLWRPDELRARLMSLGWDASVTAEGPFYWGRATM
jgi:SAM-dependent methyltransferase